MPSHPIPKEQLAQAVRRANKEGRLTEELALLALSIARLYYYTPRYSQVPHCDKEDLLGDFSLALVKHWRKLDATKNPHAYLTSMARNACLMSLRSAQRRLRKAHAKAEHDLIRENARVNQYIRAHEGRLNNGN